MASYLLVVKQYDIEKISSYECGFDPFEEDTRGKFDVRFYLVSILFIIFDIEVTYLFPWAVCLSFMDFFSFFVSKSGWSSIKIKHFQSQIICF